MELSRVGFVLVGKWKIDRAARYGIDYELKKYSSQRVLYSFVVNRKPTYIGICEKYKTSLKNRMNRYKHHTGGSTNKRVAEEIEKVLGKSKVLIYALLPKGNPTYKGTKVDLVKGLENPLIRKFNPIWNH